MSAVDTNKSAVTTAHLKRALAIVAPAIAKGGLAIPILQSVRIEQLKDGLAIEATNLDISIRALVAESDGPKQALVIPAERFLKWAKLLRGEDITITVTDRRAAFKCAQARASFPTLGASGYPSQVFALGNDGVTLKQSQVAHSLRFTQLAVSDEISRPGLTTILLVGDGERLRFVATNGTCMAVYSVPCTETLAGLMLPTPIFSVLSSLLADSDDGLDLTFNDSTIIAGVAGDMPVFVSGKQVVGQFPRWENVMPKEKRTTITVQAQEMLEALERSTALASQETSAIELTFGPDQAIVIDGADVAAGEAQETVACTGSVAVTKIRLNSKPLIDVLKKIDGSVSIEVDTDNQKPFYMKAQPYEGETLDYIVMPMRMQ